MKSISIKIRCQQKPKPQIQEKAAKGNGEKAEMCREKQIKSSGGRAPRPSLLAEEKQSHADALDHTCDRLCPALKGPSAMEKKGRLATTAWTPVLGSLVIHKASNCDTVGRARSSQSDRPGPILTPPLPSSVPVGPFTPVHLSFHCKTGTMPTSMH